MKIHYSTIRFCTKFLRCFLNLNLSFLLLIYFQISCNKFVEVDAPNTQLVTEEVFTSDATATSAVLGIYIRMMGSFGFASGQQWSVTLLTGLSSDEFVNYSTDPQVTAFYKNELSPTNTELGTFLWSENFAYIYTANAILAGLSSSTAVTDSTKKQLEGEVKFLRAFNNFYLVNLFGSVPIVISTDYKINGLVYRVPVSRVYDSIISDLRAAKILLSNDYNFSSGERTRPNKWAATAMLA